jgi:hypothetical protein
MDRQAAALAAVSGALVVLGTYALTHRPPGGQAVAQVIERGMRSDQAPAPDPEALEDERLTGDANEAGYRWAERRGLMDVAHCPNFSTSFHDGCAAYVSDQTP